MNNTFKTVVVLQIIFIAMACYGSVGDTPLEDGSLEQFLGVPYDLLPSMFCTSLQQCLGSRVLCKGKQNYFDDNEVLYGQAEQGVSKSIFFVQKYSATKVEEFLAKRIRSCIKGTFELVGFMDQSFITDKLKNDLSQSFLWPAFKKAVQEDPLTAAFVCQYTINPHCRNFIKQVIPEEEKKCLKIISCIAQNFRQTYDTSTLNLAGDNSIMHRCVIITDNLLKDATFTIGTTATSLIFNTFEILPTGQNFIQNIYSFIERNKENMKNIILMTFGSGVFLRELTDSDTMIAINNLLKERCPALKLSIQNERFDDFVRGKQLIDKERIIDHNRNNPTIYLLDSGDTQNDLSSLQSPFFFYNFIQLCKGSKIESSLHDRGINKADLYLLHKRNNGCQKMLERIKALKERLQVNGCKCEACIPRSKYLSKMVGYLGFDEFISRSQ